MSKKKAPLPPDLTIWIEARRRFRLSHAQVQMARELGFNPKGFGKLANHDQEPWKLPLQAFIEECYYKRFNRDKPERIRTIEEVAAGRKAQKMAKREAKAAKKAAAASDGAASDVPTPDGTVPDGTVPEPG